MFDKLPAMWQANLPSALSTFDKIFPCSSQPCLLSKRLPLRFFFFLHNVRFQPFGCKVAFAFLRFRAVSFFQQQPACNISGDIRHTCSPMVLCFRAPKKAPKFYFCYVRTQMAKHSPKGNSQFTPNPTVESTCKIAKNPYSEFVSEHHFYHHTF